MVGQMLTTGSQTLTEDLTNLQNSAPSWPMQFPPNLLQYVENGRNPNLFQRTFVDRVQEFNQREKGRCEGFRAFQSILAKEWAAADPEMEEEIKKVLDKTGNTMDK
jgi:mediator of RNA polymerase II transcription subunit 10